jgi:PAS domain S-box-containing protein
VHRFRRAEINPQNAYSKMIARIHPDDREKVRNFRKTAHDDYPVAVRYRYLPDDHHLLWLKDTISQKRADGTLLGTTQDITESQERESQLRQALNFLEKIMQTSPEIIYVFDLIWQKNIFSSQALLHQTGYTQEELQQLGSDVTAYLIHPEDVEKLLHHNQQVLPRLKKGELIKVEFRLYSKKTNTYVHFESVQSIFEQDAEGNNLSIIGISRNIHARKLAEAEVLKKNKELEQFAYVASHDMQEPLQTITSFTDLLARTYSGKIDTTADTYLRYITEAGTHMQMLVKELLAYSSIGRKSKPALVDTSLLIHKVLNDLSSKISKTGATFEIGRLPIIRGYETELRLLFQNLISNAVKFHRPGTPPRIKIAAVLETDCWKFSFQDNGIGIPEQYRQKIFAIFQRLHNKQEYEGTGIGLAHCRKIVELHRGEIWLDSQLHKGSTFYIRLPA